MKIKYPDNYKVTIYRGDENVRYCLGNKGDNVLFCIAINPSDANEELSDPTMNSLINIAKKKGFDGCIMLNPAPYRSPHPEDIPNKSDESVEENIRIIKELFESRMGNTVLCGWGEKIFSAPQWYKESLKRIIDLAKENNIEFVCLDENNSGAPTSISYLNRDHVYFKNGKGEYNLKEYDINKSYESL